MARAPVATSGLSLRPDTGAHSRPVPRFASSIYAPRMSRLAILFALALVPAFLGGPILTSAQTGATDTPAESEEAGEVRVWQHVDDARTIYISLRRAGARWSDAGTVLLPLDDGHSKSGSYRYGDIARGGIEARVWQHVVRERTLYISSRLEGVPWSAFATVPLSLDDGHSASGSYRYGDLVIPEPSLVQPAPALITVATGEAGVLILEWTPGSAQPSRGVTRWQYRQQTRPRAAEVDTWVWGPWTDVPGSHAATRSHRLGGVSHPEGDRHRRFYYQVRAVTGAVMGDASERTPGILPRIDAHGIPTLDWGQIVEGGRAWRLSASNLVIDVPVGTRIVLEGGGLQGGVVTVSFRDVASGTWQVVDLDNARGAGRGVDSELAQPGQGAGGANASQRDVNAIFDAILASMRVIEP